MKISWTARVRNKEILQRVQQERGILQTTKRKNANRTGHMSRRNCLLKHVSEGKIEGRTEVKGRRKITSKQLLDNLQEERRSWKLKEEALDLTLWRTRLGRGYGLVRQTTE
jgi:hypothetical protein